MRRPRLIAQKCFAIARLSMFNLSLGYLILTRKMLVKEMFVCFSIGVMPFVPQPCVRHPVNFDTYLPDGRHLTPLGLASTLGSLPCSLQVLRNVRLTNVFKSVSSFLFNRFSHSTRGGQDIFGTFANSSVGILMVYLISLP